jgi:hypothetical protein
MATWRTLGVTLLLGACVAGAQTMSPGMQAHVDPQSGALVPEAVGPVAPALPAPPPAPPAAEIPAPGGGMMVDIRGRFMSSVVATIAADGSLHVDCVTSDHVHDHE